MIFNKTNLTAKLKSEGIFYTPITAFKNIFARITQNIDLSEVKSAYDPACGIGNLFCVVDEKVQKYGQDINVSQLEIASKTLQNFCYFHGDTLVSPAFSDKHFDLIVANPPFSIKWNNQNWKTDSRFNRAPAAAPNSKADYAFILHCLHVLNEKGYAVIIAFPGILYRGNSEGKIRSWLIENGYIHRVMMIAPKTFEDTSIATVVLLLHKKPAQSVLFIDQNGKEIRATFKQIRDNHYNLTPQHCFPETVKPGPTDEEIRANDAQVKELFFQNFKKKISFDIWLEQMFYKQTAVATNLAYLQRFREVIDELTRQVRCGVLNERQV